MIQNTIASDLRSIGDTRTHFRRQENYKCFQLFMANAKEFSCNVTTFGTSMAIVGSPEGLRTTPHKSTWRPQSSAPNAALSRGIPFRRGQMIKYGSIFTSTPAASWRGHRSRWISLPGILKEGSWKELPAVPGVYVVYSGKTVVYIGSAHNIRNRISSHQVEVRCPGADSHDWRDYPRLRLKYKTFARFGEWLMVEARLIQRLQPASNRKLKNKISPIVVQLNSKTFTLIEVK